jgi:hypothetical protein
MFDHGKDGHGGTQMCESDSGLRRGDVFGDGQWIDLTPRCTSQPKTADRANKEKRCSLN